ncbi:MAG: hypothetical protein CLLPBCKN_005174 [Chroococcidiopsis cubana SAG 39.79]|jgi:hypothetical protein|nr:hypothetical protein [Chroococcidiopsis cubana SAG 39.79]
MPVVRRNTLGEIQTPLHICQRAVRECDSRIKPRSTKLIDLAQFLYPSSQSPCRTVAILTPDF